MTIANEIPAHNNIVTARQVYRGLALKILAVEKLIIFDPDVMSLIELDQVQSIVILHWIIEGRASVRRTVVMYFAVANRYVTCPETTVIPRGGVTTRRIVGLYAVESIVRFIHAIAVNSISSGIQLLTRFISIVGIGENVESINHNSTS